MSSIECKIIKADDLTTIELIADWYFSEWNIPKHTTIDKIQSFSEQQPQFQVLVTIDSKPVATGGIYNHVSLHNKEPKFLKYKHWLALIYTLPQFRNQGIGSILCHFIENQAKKCGLKELFLFTHTAENLYLKLEWKTIDRLFIDNKNIAIMKKEI